MPFLIEFTLPVTDKNDLWDLNGATGSFMTRISALFLWARDRKDERLSNAYNMIPTNLNVRMQIQSRYPSNIHNDMIKLDLFRAVFNFLINAAYLTRHIRKLKWYVCFPIDIPLYKQELLCILPLLLYGVEFHRYLTWGQRLLWFGYCMSIRQWRKCRSTLWHLAAKHKYLLNLELRPYIISYSWLQ